MGVILKAELLQSVTSPCTSFEADAQRLIPNTIGVFNIIYFSFSKSVDNTFLYSLDVMIDDELEQFSLRISDQAKYDQYLLSKDTARETFIRKSIIYILERVL